MHQADLILTLTGGLIAALAFGLLSQRLGLSPIVGYLVAGIAVSPNTPGFVADKALADQLAEVGVILLLFGVGLQFHFKDLLAVRGIAIPGALVQSLVATLLGAGVVHFLGWGWSPGIVFGLALSVASTVVLTRVLGDNRALNSPTGRIAIGWLVVEDILTVLVLVLLPTLLGASARATPSGIAVAVGVGLLKVGALVGVTGIVGGWAIPRLLRMIARTESRELFTLAVLAIALGIAVASAKFFGVSMALGAFLAGMVVGRSEFSLRAATEALPMRDAFAVLFFVSVGMLFDVRTLWESPGLVAATLAIVLVGKPLSALLLLLLLRHPLRTALSVSVALAQIGEFSFILASMGRDLRVLPEQGVHVLVAAALVSITANPLLYRSVGAMERWVDRWPRLRDWIRDRATPTGAPSARPARQGRRAVVVGHGPVGATVVRLLEGRGFASTLVEMNIETVGRLRAQGRDVVYGDAGRPDTLEHAGIRGADVLVLSASGLGDGREILRMARALNPRIRVFARTTYLRDARELRAAGVEGVFSEEGEVALAMAGAILDQFDASPEQVRMERERVRQELQASSPHRDDAPGSEAR